MQYFGGKSRISKKIAEIVNKKRGGLGFWDPFCGGLSVSLSLGGRGLITDVHLPLISLYKAVANGWVPPTSLSEDEYQGCKLLEDTDPLKAFAGYACSFGGKWFGGYARGEELREPQRTRRIAKFGYASWQYAEIASKSLVRDVRILKLRGCDFRRFDFMDISIKRYNCIFYLDPPYRRRTNGYSGTFDFERFDNVVNLLKSKGNILFVSEYELPYGSCVWVAPSTTEGMTPGKRPDRPREKLFLIEK